MKQWRRDPVTIRLGTDIASIIHLMIFRWKLSNVNAEYKAHTTKGFCNVIYFLGRPLNFRGRYGDSRHGNNNFAYSTFHRIENAHGRFVAIVPKNYCP